MDQRRPLRRGLFEDYRYAIEAGLISTTSRYVPAWELSPTDTPGGDPSEAGKAIPRRLGRR